MAENYNLSLTAEDIDSRLKKIQDGGVGYTDGETIHQIEAKYLPGVCLPVVELETVVTVEGAALPEAENETLDKAAENGPFIVKCKMDVENVIVSVSSVINIETYGDIVSAANLIFVAGIPIGLIIYNEPRDDGSYAWSIGLQPMV